MPLQQAAASKTRLLESEVVMPALLERLTADFSLDIVESVHGPDHWARVRDNGLRLAGLTGARTDVIELFAVLHDCRRKHEFDDPQHGSRAADYLSQVGSHFRLTADAHVLLEHAIRYHADGLLVGDITVQVCWDADRLDLGRVGIAPHADRLCTDAARKLLLP
jgi:uncharacterized protein